MDDFDDQIKQTTKNPWYAVRTFNCQELKISDFLKERKKVHFVPMTYVEKEKEGKTRKMLVPVVHNLVFLQKNESRKATLAMLKECNVPFSVLCDKETKHPCEIPDKQMTEFRSLYADIPDKRDFCRTSEFYHFKRGLCGNQFRKVCRSEKLFQIFEHGSGSHDSYSFYSFLSQSKSCHFYQWFLLYHKKPERTRS